MKRILSKRSGFTLIEIIVAFAIFAIMSTMLTSMVQLTLAQRNSNKEFQDAIERDTTFLAAHYITDADAYGTDETASGTFNLEFSDGSKYSMDYAIRNTGDSGDQGLNYFVGDTAYTGLEGLEDEDDDGESILGGMGQTSRYDVRIAGTKNMAYVQVYKVVKDESYSGAGARYFIEVAASGTDDTVPEDEVRYCSYRLIFRDDDQFHYIDKTEDGTTYRYCVPKDVTIKEWGYVNDTDLVWDSDCVAADEHIPKSSATYNKYEVIQTSDNTLRIAPPVGSSGGYALEGSVVTRIWVVFNTDPGLTTTSFGANGTKTDGSTPPDGWSGVTRYKNYVINEATGKVNPNVYGAFEFTKEEIVS